METADSGIGNAIDIGIGSGSGGGIDFARGLRL